MQCVRYNIKDLIVCKMQLEGGCPSSAEVFEDSVYFSGLYSLFFVFKNQPDGSARRTSQTEQLDGPARRTIWTDQFFIFEALQLCIFQLGIVQALYKHVFHL